MKIENALDYIGLFSYHQEIEIIEESSGNILYKGVLGAMWNLFNYQMLKHYNITRCSSYNKNNESCCTVFVKLKEESQ